MCCIAAATAIKWQSFSYNWLVTRPSAEASASTCSSSKQLQHLRFANSSVHHPAAETQFQLLTHHFQEFWE